MTIILDLNTDQLRTEPLTLDLAPADTVLERLRFESAPMDTVMVISARQRRHPATNTPSPNRHGSPQAANDEGITWEDAEWQ